MISSHTNITKEGKRNTVSCCAVRNEQMFVSVSGCIYWNSWETAGIQLLMMCEQYEKW